MDTLLNNPLLQPQYINKVIQSIPIDTRRYMLADMVPLQTYEADKVVIDVEHSMGGMTQAVARAAESPIIDQWGASQVEFKPAQFREKWALSENDVAVIRRLGTIDQLERAETRIAKIVRGLRMRLENRMEWAKWQMIAGSLTIAQADVQFTVSYAVPSEFTPTLTGTDVWDNASSDPMANILDWLNLYRSEAAEPAMFVYNMNVEKVLLENTEIRNLRDSLFTGQPNEGMISRENLQLVFKAYGGAIPTTVYDKGYWIVMRCQSAMATATTTLVVDDASGVEDGDVLTLEHRDSIFAGRAQVTVSGTPVGNTITLAAGHGQTVTYPVGSVVKIRKPFIPDDKFIILGETPPGTMGLDRWAEFASTYHYYGPGGLMNPTPGMFIKVVNKEDSDPPRIEVISGVNGLPALYNPTNNVYATVL
jgi:hypothetical protein